MPAYFSDTQRQATREAGEIAGLEVVRIINEPTAAALVYEAGQHEGKRILVYDLGGGTFDVSVVRIEEGVVEVISSHGNNHLGGDDFDQKIVAHILEHLKIGPGGRRVRPTARDGAHPPRRRSGEAAPVRSPVRAHRGRVPDRDRGQAGASVDGTGPRRVRSDDRAVHVQETLQAIHTALRSADLTASQVEEILLVGGATRTPMIRRRLAEVFGHEPAAKWMPICAWRWVRRSRARRSPAPRYRPCWSM